MPEEDKAAAAKALATAAQRRSGQTTEQINRQDELLSNLSTLIDDLAARLSPVRHEVGLEPVNKVESSEDVPDLVLLAGRLDGHNSRIVMMSRQLTHIIETVEV